MRRSSQKHAIFTAVIAIIMVYATASLAQSCSLTSIDPNCPSSPANINNPNNPANPINNPYSGENVSNPYSPYNLRHPESPTSGLNPSNQNNIKNPDPSSSADDERHSKNSKKGYEDPHLNILFFLEGDKPTVFWKASGVEHDCKINVDCPRFIYTYFNRPAPERTPDDPPVSSSPKHRRQR